MKHLMFVFLFACFSLTACNGQSRAKKVGGQSLKKLFSMPVIPSTLTSPDEKAEFVVTRYWDRFDFSDTTLILRADYTEQAFADFVNVLPHVSAPLALRGIDTLMTRAADSAMYAHFMELSEKYLYDPNSPFRSEELYIGFLRHIIANENLEEILKVRPQYQLEMALKNRVGEKASDFEYTTLKGGKTRLYAANGERILLFFFRSDCSTCKETKEYVRAHDIDKLVEIVWVDPDKDTHIDTLYDLRASPTLYLLDKDKTVLLKDAPIELIEQYLTKCGNTKI